MEDALLDLHGRFAFREVAYDPWQMTHLASRLQAGGLGRLAGQPRLESARDAAHYLRTGALQASLDGLDQGSDIAPEQPAQRGEEAG